MTFKHLIDWIARGKTPEIIEAERDNMRVDRKQVDASLNRFMAARDEFGLAVEELIRDLHTSHKRDR